MHMDEFLEAYYGEGWEGIRAFIDLTTELASNEGSCINIYEAPLNSITKEERRVILNALKSFEIPLDGYRPIEEAIVTSGGVEVKEIIPKTMESRIVPGLYFCGEVIDVDAYTGGYNLQIAFSTGYLAGKSAAES